MSSNSIEDVEKTAYGEKTPEENVQVLPADDAAHDDILVDVHSGIRDGVQRKMRQRHMQMIALAGTLGTGLFLGSGRAISHAGPAGALIAYCLIGTVIWSMMQGLAEMAIYAPVSGGYVHMAERYIHPSAGFALGYMQWYSGLISLPTELIAATLILGFWVEMTKAKLAGFIMLFIVICTCFNFLGVRWYAESEFWFSMIKIALILGLILGGLIVDLGANPAHDRIGFRYWKDPGAFASFPVPGNVGKFTGWFQTLLQAAYSFSGIEGIALASAEVVNPRANLASVSRKIFWRILFFYVFGILIVGMLVPSSDPNILKSTGTAASSPFVVAFRRVGIKALPSVINAGVLTSAFSAANANLYTTSRLLYGLSVRGQAPRIFSKTSKGGIPVYAQGISVLFALLAFMTLSDGGSTVLNWFSNLTSIASFIAWMTIAISFLRFKAACDAQGIDRSASPYLYNRFQPWPAYWVTLWCGINIIFNGYQCFMKGGWSTSNFLTAYLNLPLVGGLFLGHWLFTGRKRFPRASAIDMHSNVPGPEIDVDPHPPTTKLAKFMHKLL